MYQILVVDDQQIEIDAIEWLIQKHSLPLVLAQANNGETGLAYIKNNHVDILFTDIRMPFMDGLELAKQAKVILPDLKIIIYSAYGEFEYAKRAIQLGTINYILKPIEVDEFLAVMKEVIVFCENDLRRMEREKQLLTGSFVWDKGSTCLTSNLKDNEMDDILQPIFKSIEQRNNDDLEQCLEILIERLGASESMSSLYVKLVFTSIIKTVYETYGKKENQTLTVDLERIAESETIVELKELCLSIFQKLVKLDDRSDENNRKVIEEVIRLIHMEYGDDIGLDYLAGKVHLSSSYLSFLFKKVVGQSLGKYITGYRMERAKELMRDTTLKVIDVGIQVGYTNPSYFNLMFKQYFDMTPVQYRERGDRR